MSADFDIQIPATEQQIAEAIRWAADHDANVIRRLAFEQDRLKEEIEYLKSQLAEQDKQAARAIEEAAYDAACEAERELQRGIRSREDGWG